MRPAAVTVFGGPTSQSAFDIWLAWVAGGCVVTRSVECLTAAYVNTSSGRCHRFPPSAAVETNLCRACVCAVWEDGCTAPAPVMLPARDMRRCVSDPTFRHDNQLRSPLAAHVLLLGHEPSTFRGNRKWFERLLAGARSAR